MNQSLIEVDQRGEHHAEHDSRLQHHFATFEQQFDAAKIGMWLFLATEILMFGGLFVGYGLPVKVIVVAFMTTPVMVVYTVRGLTSVNAETRELMASIESTPGQVYRLVQIPTALPYIFTALKSMVVLALIGVIVTEAMRGFEGLGFLIADAMSGFEAATAWLALVAIAFLGIVAYLIVGLVERLVVPWDAASRASS